jgi:hypothetical protein
MLGTSTLRHCITIRRAERAQETALNQPRALPQASRVSGISRAEPLAGSPTGVNCPRKLGEHPLEHIDALLEDLSEIARIGVRDLPVEIGQLRVEYLAKHRGIFK